jgi:hypothetical protein
MCQDVPFQEARSAEASKAEVAYPESQEHALEAPHLPSGVYVVNLVVYEIWSNYMRAKIG